MEQSMPPKPQKHKDTKATARYPKNAIRVRDKTELMAINQIFGHSWCRAGTDLILERLKDTKGATAKEDRQPKVDLLLDDSQGFPNSFGVIVQFGFRRMLTEEGLEALPDLTESLKAALESDEIPPAERIMVNVEANYFLEMYLMDNKGITEEDIWDYARHNAPNFAWGLWREFVHSATGRMGIPAVTLGVLLPSGLRPKPEADTNEKPKPVKKSAKKSNKK